MDTRRQKNSLRYFSQKTTLEFPEKDPRRKLTFSKQIEESDEKLSDFLVDYFKKAINEFS